MEPVGILCGQRREVTRGEAPPFTWSVGGGKGGVGKSMVSIMLAYWLGQMKRRVILVDADLGASNLHTLLGIRVPRFTLEDFLLHRADDLEAVLLPTPFESVSLLAGGYDVIALANPNYAQKTRILRALGRLQADALVVDLGGGTSLNVLDFFLSSPGKLVVMTPQPTSVQNAYGFIKSALLRQITRLLSRDREAAALLTARGMEEQHGTGQTVPELVDRLAVAAPRHESALHELLRAFQASLIVNMARGSREVQAGEVVRQVCHRYLGVEVEQVGAIPYEPAFERWAATMDTACFLQTDRSASQRLVYNLTSHSPAFAARAA